MRTRKALAAASLAMSASIGLVGCSPGSGYTTSYGNEADRVTPDRGTARSECVYAPTYNNDWHDDMLCGDVRPYLLPNDDFVTRDELEAAARRWASGYDDEYEQYRLDYEEYLEREREFDELYLSQFDEYGNCMNPNGCSMQRP